MSASLRSRRRGLYSTMGDPTSFVSATTSTSSSTTMSRSTAAHTASSLARYYFHLRLRPEQPDNARGAFTYTGQFTRQRVRRFPPRISDLGHVRHRPRRRGRPHQLAASVRAGRLADARQPDRQRRPAVRVQPAHVRREQSAVIDRSVGAGRPIRDRQRRARQHQSRRAGAAAADSDLLRDVGGGRVGPRAARPERRSPRPAHGLCAELRRLRRRHPRRLRHLPQPMGLQRADGVRAEPAVLLHQAGRRSRPTSGFQRSRRATS